MVRMLAPATPDTGMSGQGGDNPIMMTTDAATVPEGDSTATSDSMTTSFDAQPTNPEDSGPVYLDMGLALADAIVRNNDSSIPPAVDAIPPVEDVSINTADAVPFADMAIGPPLDAAPMPSDVDEDSIPMQMTTADLSTI